MVDPIRIHSPSVQQPVVQADVEQPQSRAVPRGPADAPRDMAADHRNATTAVNRHHAEGGGMVTRAFQAAGGAGSAAKVTSSLAGATAKLTLDEARAVRSEHVAATAGKIGGGIAFITGGYALYETIHAHGEVRRGEAAEKQLGELARNIGDKGVTTDDLKQMGELTEAIAKGQEAKAKRVEAGLEFVKSSGEVLKAATEVTGHAVHAGAFVGGAAAGLVSIGLGAYKVHEARKQEAGIQQKMQALGHAAKSDSLGTHAKALKEAAEDIKDSRQKHISNSKWGGIAKIGLGIAALGLVAAVAVLSAPVILPIAGIGMVCAGVAAGVTGIVRGVEKRRSEQKINATIQAAVESKGSMSHDQVVKHLVNIKSNNLSRDTARITKINAATASINQTLDRLANLPPGAQSLSIKDEIIRHFTDDGFVKGSQKEALGKVLSGLNPENIEAQRGFLLGTLAKNMMSLA